MSVFNLDARGESLDDRTREFEAAGYFYDDEPAFHAPSEYVWRCQQEREERKRRDREELQDLWREEMRTRRRERARIHYRRRSDDGAL